MKILSLKITLRAQWVHSLKEKRMILLSISKKLKNKFNISVSEIGSQDIHQIIEIGIVQVGSSSKVLNSSKEHIINFIEDNTDAELFKIEEEIIVI